MRVRRIGVTIVGVFSVAVLLALTGAANAACYQCSGDEPCRAVCTASSDDEFQDHLFDAVCVPLDCVGATSNSGAFCGEGAFSDCAMPFEACCLPDGGCLDVTAENCAAMSGASSGPGTACPAVAEPGCTRCTDVENCPAGPICVGSFDDDVADFFFFEICGFCGSSSGTNASCEDVTECTTPLGACNTDSSTVPCLVIAESHCGDLGGTYLGDGSECGNDFCPVPTATPTDTPTATPTDTPTITPTATPTDTPTVTPTATPTSTAAPQGAGCQDTSQCESGLFCADGVCCEVVCDGPGEICNLTGREGQCTTVASAPSVERLGLIVACLVLLGIAAVTLVPTLNVAGPRLRRRVGRPPRRA